MGEVYCPKCHVRETFSGPFEHTKTRCPRCATLLLQGREEEEVFRRGGEAAVRSMRLRYGLLGGGILFGGILLAKTVWESTHSSGAVVAVLAVLIVAAGVVCFKIAAWRDRDRAGFTKLSVDDRMNIAVLMGLLRGKEVQLDSAMEGCLKMMGFLPRAIEALSRIRAGETEGKARELARRAGLQPPDTEVLRGFLGLVERFMKEKAAEQGVRWGPASAPAKRLTPRRQGP